MSEHTMWVRLRREIGYAGDLVRVENPVHPGTPDVNYCFAGAEGWVELKEIATPNENRKGVVEIKHFTPQQRIWLKRRWNNGGHAFLLLHIAATDNWLLFDGDVAAEFVGRASWTSLLGRARSVFPSLIDPARLVRDLRTGRMNG